MKTLLITMALLSSLVSFASDEFKTDIVCSNHVTSESSLAFGIFIQSNPTAWTKRILVVEYGYHGKIEMGSFTIPLKQPSVTPGWDGTLLSYYSVNGFSLIV